VQQPALSTAATALPLLTYGEPACPDIAFLSPSARDAILGAALGPLRRAGAGWYARDKARPFRSAIVRGLIARKLLFSPEYQTARLTKRGRWLARTICSAIAGDTLRNLTGGQQAMPRRKLTEGCLHAMRTLLAGAGPLDIHNRTVASNLRIVERVFPEYVSITPAPAAERGPGCPLFAAALTARGRAFLTPRKLRYAAFAEPHRRFPLAHNMPQLGSV